MTGSARRTVIVAMAALVVALTLVWSASVGPGVLVGDSSRSGPVVVASDPSPSATPSPEADRRSQEAEPRALTHATTWVTDVVTVAAVLGGTWFVAVVARFLLLALRRRLSEPQLVVALESLPREEAARASLHAQADRLREALATGAARNAIVSCWVLLEEAAAGSGVPRLPAETATEFVVRLLHSLDVDPRPVAELVGLFHEARFSTHTVTDDARVRARAALERVLADLAAAPGVPA